jgi:hypothetical protein
LIPALGLSVITIASEPILLEFKDLSTIFLEDEAQNLAKHGLHKLVINLHDEKQPPWGPIYSLTEKEPAVPSEFIPTNLEYSWIQPSTFMADPPVFFMLEKDRAMRL